MDIPAGNTLPDPYGGTGQPPYPWRGRITCHPGAGPIGIARRHALRRRSAVNQFFAREWGFRRMVAALCGAREGSGRRRRLHPRQRTRRADPRALCRRASIRPSKPCGTLPRRCARSSAPAPTSSMRRTGRNTARMCSTAATRCAFPLDPLFAHPAIDAVGIDYYPPISDWRDGARPCRSRRGAQRLRRRLSAPPSRRGRSVRLVLSRMRPRASRSRARRSPTAPIGKPWVFRAKDLVSWWSNRHVERVSGSETGADRHGSPQSKPIWLTEIGIPAVDKGPNGPNVFPDPKSSEIRLSAVLARHARRPHAGARPRGDPFALRSGARTGFRRPTTRSRRSTARAWSTPRTSSSGPGTRGRFRPSRISTRSGPTAATGRPGHWITGRIEGVPLDRLIAAILKDFGLPGAGDDTRRRLSRRLRDRPADVGARSARNA